MNSSCALLLRLYTQYWIAVDQRRMRQWFRARRWHRCTATLTSPTCKSCLPQTCNDYICFWLPHAGFHFNSTIPFPVTYQIHIPTLHSLPGSASSLGNTFSESHYTIDGLSATVNSHSTTCQWQATPILIANLCIKLLPCSSYAGQHRPCLG